MESLPNLESLSIQEPSKSDVKVMTIKKRYTDSQMKNKEGTFFDETDIIILTEDTDIFIEDNKILLKFRKNVFSNDLQQLALKCYSRLGKKKSYQRGTAGGMQEDKHENKQENKNEKGTRGGVMGYMDPTSWNRKCRLTAFSKEHFIEYTQGLPFIEAIDQQLKLLLPQYHHYQHIKAHQTEFVINNTAFSTITVNANFRTALHKDSGDYKEGFGTLAVCGNNYTGGYTMFPQYLVGVDMRSGDFLAMNVHEWHCNSPIIFSPKFQNQKPSQQEPIRLAFVCYLRDKMVNCYQTSEILKGQETKTTEEKIEDLVGSFPDRLELGKSKEGRKWYTLIGTSKYGKFEVRYYNKSYKVTNLDTGEVVTSLTKAYKTFVLGFEKEI